MKRVRVCVRGVVCFFFLISVNVTGVNASIFINEFLADPPSGVVGDANGDGVTSFRDDEFVEIYNLGEETFNLSGWSLSDGLRVRHIFEMNTYLDSLQYLVVFGGGDINIGINGQLASTGQLSLNNSSDTITLLDEQNNLVDQLVYDSIANKNQSVVRMGQELFLHSSHTESGGALFSPGKNIDGSDSQLPTSAIPEPQTWMLLLVGLSFMMFQKRSVLAKV